MLLILLNILAVHTSENLPEESKIFNLFFSNSFYNSLFIDCLDIQGLQPCEWMKYDVFSNQNDEKENNFKITLNLYEFLSSIDSKNFDILDQLIIRLNHLIKYSSVVLHDSVVITIAFCYYFFKKEPDLAIDYLSTIKNKFKPTKLN